jgi:phage terminase large subunit-like protein
VALLSALVLESGARWGEVARPWQLADAHAVLDGSGPTHHFITRPRGASKTSDLAGIALSALLTAEGDFRGFGVAADREQARLLIDEMSGFARRTPELAGAVTSETWKVSTGSGSVVAIASDGAGAYGLRPNLVIADEVAQWPTTMGARQVWEAVTSSLPKTPGARLVVLTTSGDPAHWSHRVLEHARASAAWRVSELPGPCEWVDQAALAEQRALLPESSYQRLHLNRWVSGEGRLVSIDDLNACVTLPGPLPAERGVRYCIAVDLGLVRDRTVACVVHGERLDRLAPREQRRPATINNVMDQEQAAAARRGRYGAKVVLDRLQVWQGSRANPVQLEQVEDWVVQAWRQYNRASVTLDIWQTAGLGQRLKARGVRVAEFTFNSASVGRLAGTMLQLLRDHNLALPNDPELLDELANVRLRETSPGMLRMDHDPDKHDDRAIALAMGANAVLDKPDYSRKLYAW